MAKKKIIEFEEKYITINQAIELRKLGFLENTPFYYNIPRLVVENIPTNGRTEEKVAIMTKDDAISLLIKRVKEMEFWEGVAYKLSDYIEILTHKE